MSAAEAASWGMFAVVVGLALTALSWRLCEWNDRLEERRKREDAAAFRAQLAAMDAAETAAWEQWADKVTRENLRADLEWDGICRVVGLEESDAATRIKRILQAQADRRACEDMERRWSA